MVSKIGLNAPNGQFRVVGVDTFDGTVWIIGDFDTYSHAINIAKENGRRMLKTHVYDDQGKHIFEAGTF